MFSSLVAAAPSTPPAGGAAIGEILIASVSAMVLTTALLVFGLGHRRGTVPHLTRLAGFSERVSGLPGWAALPCAVAGGSLLIAVFGMYWDIALHAGDGRDEGPLANPAHYFILVGLYGIFTAGFLAMVLPKEKPSASAIAIGPGWHAPLGGVLIAACGAFSLIGFPLDDVWHRIFGQDVTLWGPTHLMLIGGAAMTLLGIAVLLVEGRRSLAAQGRSHAERSFVAKLLPTMLAGGVLAGLSTFQAEFDFGIPQFRAVFQPVMFMMAAGVGLVAMRVWLGRGAALGAVAFFVLVRGALAVVVGPVLGESTPYFPLYLAEAVIVELVALAIVVRERPLAFGAWCGVLIGTVGLAAEWAWTQVFMPLPWNGAMLPEGVVLGLITAVAGSLLGAWVGARLASEQIPRTPSLRTAAVVGAIGLAGVTGFSLLGSADTGVRADVALTEVDPSAPASERTVDATVRMRPASAGEDAHWLTMTAWQGKDKIIVDRMRRVSDGVYETTRPIPVHGSWKTVVRLHSGDSLTGIPVYMPADDAIPAPAVAAPARFDRGFVGDKELLQREQQPAATVVTVLAYLAVVGIALALLALLAWGLHRLAVAAPGGARSGSTGDDPSRPAPPRRERVLTASR